jgi:hypothetical protein
MSLPASYNRSVSDFKYRDSSGVLSAPIWLLADSRPRKAVTREPLDPRHPTRHTIWTPILDQIQDRVFEACGSRLDTRRLYIRNAVERADEKKLRSVVDQAIRKFRDMAISSHPILILCFGQFAFEFARRACDQPSSVDELWKEWSVEELGREFHNRIASVSPERVTVLRFCTQLSPAGSTTVTPGFPMKTRMRTTLNMLAATLRTSSSRIEAYLD